MNWHDLIGTWRLASAQSIDHAGVTSDLYGERPVGYIVYALDGYMSVIITTGNRPDFAVDDVLSGSSDERATAAATCLSYAGRYELIDEQVVHSIEVSLFPNWVGQQQRRYVELTGERLTLSTGWLLVGGRQQRGFLVWERVATA